MYTFYESPYHLGFATFDGGASPFVSIYLQTHRGSQETKQDKLTLKNLVLEAEHSLKEYYGKREYTNILENLEALFENPEEGLWRGLKDGLAVLVDNENMYVCLLEYPVQNQSIVADSFHIKPLIKGFQFTTEYYLLELSKERFDLYYGDARGFEKVELPADMKNVFKEAFPERKRESLLSVSSFGEVEASYHSLEPKVDFLDVDREKDFRYADRMVYKILGDDSQIPVILVALTEHQVVFRAISSLDGLLEKGIDARMMSLGNQNVLREAITLVVDAQKNKVSQMADEFGSARAAGKASADPSEIAAALAQRKVSLLFIDEGILNPGHFDSETGSISYESIGHAEVDDLGDDFAQATYEQGGTAYVLAHDEMPSETGMAAIFRY